MRETYEERAESVLADYVPKLPPAVHGIVVQCLADLQEEAENGGRNHVIGVCAVEDGLVARVIAALRSAAESGKGWS